MSRSSLHLATALALGLTAALAPAAARADSTLAIEALGTGTLSGSPYVQHRGYDFENGFGFGTRLQALFLGMFVAYDYTYLPNTKACGVSCVESDDFGATKLHSLDLGYRLTLPIPFLDVFAEAGLGGVYGHAGLWSEAARDAIYGGEGRLGAGLSIPIVPMLHATFEVQYRLMLTTNPFFADSDQAVDAAFLGDEPDPRDRMEDGHFIVFLLGLGAGI